MWKINTDLAHFFDMGQKNGWRFIIDSDKRIKDGVSLIEILVLIGHHIGD